MWKTGGIYLVFYILLNNSTLFSQNLFINGDFELAETNCPYPNPSTFSMGAGTSGWYNVTGWHMVGHHNGSSDPFYSCATSALYPNHPVTNFRGTQVAQSGTNYAGLVTYRDDLANAREYIVAELTTPLCAGETYNLSFYISSSDESQWASSPIQWLFSNTIPDVGLDPTKPWPNSGYYGKQLKKWSINPCTGCQYTPVITDENSWSLVTSTYTANGGELFFTLGNFENDNNTNVVSKSGPGVDNVAAYYFDNFILTGNVACSPLPVELIRFEAICKESYAELSWETVSEFNNDYFSIEKSLDGLNFIEIGQVTGAGSSQAMSKYNFIDQNRELETIYYRLKQVDFNGQYEYSNVIAVDCTTNEESLEVYPNPVQNELNVVISNNKHTASDIKIYDLTGKIVFKQQLNPLKKGTHKVTLNVEFLASSMYTITVKTEDKLHCRKFSK